MTVYGETLVLGLDLRQIKDEWPRGMGASRWLNEYRGFWPNYINEMNHHSMFMFAMGMPPESIVYGIRAEYYFENFAHKTVLQMKSLIAREISRTLKIRVQAEQIKPHYVQYTLDEEDLAETVG